MTHNAQHMNALQYVVNTAGTATVAHFDDDFDPIGPKLREALMPTFMTTNDHGKLILTGTGSRALARYAAETNRPAPLPSRATPIDPAHAAGVKPTPFPVETGDALLVRLGTDALAWATDFAARYTVVPVPGTARIEDTASIVLGWFANAIEAGRSAGRAEGVRDYLNAAEDKSGDAPTYYDGTF